MTRSITDLDVNVDMQQLTAGDYAELGLLTEQLRLQSLAVLNTYRGRPISEDLVAEMRRKVMQLPVNREIEEFIARRTIVRVTATVRPEPAVEHITIKAIVVAKEPSA